MADQLQFRGGTTAEYGSFVGADREITVDTTLKALRIHDGSTTGGHLVINKADVETLIAALQTSSSYNLAQENTARTEAIAAVTAALNSAIAARDAADVATLTTAQSYADTAVSNIVGGAPGLLDTLNELAAAIGDDENFIATITSANSALGVRLTALETDTTSATAVAAVQTDVDANEAAALSARNAIQSDVDANEAAALAARTAIQADVDQNEADADTAIAAVQSAVNLRATLDDPTFTTKIKSPEFHSAGSHLKFKADTNDIVFYPNNTETLQITRHHGTGHPTFTANGGTGEFKFNQITDLAGGLKIGGTEVTATAAQLNTVAGCTSGVQAQIDAEETARTAADTNLSGRLDTLESDPITASAVASAVATEAANRATGDTNEASTRGAADLALQAAIDAAAAADSAARVILQAAIDTINIDRTQLEERLLHAGLSTGNLYVTNFTGG